jgi:hypothetical protein
MTKYPTDYTLETNPTGPASRTEQKAFSPAAWDTPTLEIPKQGATVSSTEIPRSLTAYPRKSYFPIPANILEYLDKSASFSADPTQTQGVYASTLHQYTPIQTYDSAPRLPWYSHPRMGTHGQHLHHGRELEVENSIVPGSSSTPTIWSSGYTDRFAQGVVQDFAGVDEASAQNVPSTDHCPGGYYTQNYPYLYPI